MVDPIAVLVGFLAGWFILLPLARVVHRRYGLAVAATVYVLGAFPVAIVYSAIKAALP